MNTEILFKELVLRALWLLMKYALKMDVSGAELIAWRGDVKASRIIDYDRLTFPESGTQ